MTEFQVHSEREMKRVLGLPNVELIGINNRSLGIFPTSHLLHSYCLMNQPGLLYAIPIRVLLASHA